MISHSLNSQKTAASLAVTVHFPEGREPAGLVFFSIVQFAGRKCDCGVSRAMNTASANSACPANTSLPENPAAISISGNILFVLASVSGLITDETASWLTALLATGLANPQSMHCPIGPAHDYETGPQARSASPAPRTYSV